MIQQVRRILVVEDEAELREIIVEFLLEDHCEVVEASNGEEALNILKQETFALIVSDISMPKLNGHNLIIAARTIGIQTPFVFVTGHNDQENMLKALRLGAFDFIPKPFDRDELSEVVNRALEVGARLNQNLEIINNSDEKTKREFNSNENIIRLVGIKNYKKRSG